MTRTLGSVRGAAGNGGPYRDRAPDRSTTVRTAVTNVRWSMGFETQSERLRHRLVRVLSTFVGEASPACGARSYSDAQTCPCTRFPPRVLLVAQALAAWAGSCSCQ